MNVITFDKHPLLEILKSVSSGEAQLPDFQRGWIWDDQHIRDLLASISQSFPIGTVMTLTTGGDGANFKPRPVEGTDESTEQKTPDTLILDGQQRLTSLFQSLRAGRPVKTKNSRGQETSRWYYFDMEKCLDERFDREEAVISVPENRISKNFRNEILLDLSSDKQEYEHGMFPAHKIFNSADWRRGYNKYHEYTEEKAKLFDTFEANIIKKVEQYNVPVIILGKDTPKEAVCKVFEKVNTGGVTLTVFELLTASFAGEDFQLRDDWQGRHERLKDEHPVLESVENTEFLQAVTLLATNSNSDSAVSCRRRDILRLTVSEYQSWADQVETGFIQAARFLHGQKIFNASDLPYQTQLTGLAAIFADLGSQGDTEGVHQKLTRWYWCGVFGEIYGGPTETQLVRDFSEVAGWVRGGGEEPSTIRDANFQANRLLTLRTRNSAAYKGIHALLMRDGSRDFRKGLAMEYQIFFDDRIDIHHIFPKAWCEKIGIPRNIFNSIINKTPLAAHTNGMIGKKAPSAYLPSLERDAGIDSSKMDEILTSHCISADALRTDDFSGFYEARANALLDRIEAAMGKAVGGEDEEGMFEVEIPYPEE